MIIVKPTSIIGPWIVAHSNLTDMSDYYLSLNTSAAEASGRWGISPTSTVFGMTPSLFGNGEFIAYCWAQTPSVSSFGKYTGNSSRLTVSTGFRPSFVMIKATGSGNWFMFDNARGASNALYANLSEEESDTGAIEFLDNGFQLLFGLPGLNQSGQTYIYAAFANPEDAAFAKRQLRREVRQEERQQNETPLR